MRPARAAAPSFPRKREPGVIGRAAGALALILLVASAAPAAPLFEDVTAASGIPPIRYGEGVNIVDLDGDRLPEIFLPCVKGPNRLFRNLGGGKFADATAELGPFGRNGIGALVADLGGDPRPEIVVVSGAWPSGEILLFAPGEGGRYREIAAAAGIAFSGNGIMPTAADVDGDGRLELFVTVWGRNLLFRNLGGSRGVSLREDAAGAGLAAPGRSWGATFADFTGDGLPDLFVARGGSADAGSSRLYVNAGGGRFEDRTDATDVPSGGWQMGGVPLDADGDGDLDLFVTSFDDRDRLYLNDGRGGLREAPAASGIRSSRSVGAAAGDVDGDLRPDLVVAGFAGGVRAWRSLGGGGFEETTAAWGLEGTRPRNEGIALADVDGDGDLDLYVTNYDGENRLFRNRRAPLRSTAAGMGAGTPSAFGFCSQAPSGGPPPGPGKTGRDAPLRQRGETREIGPWGFRMRPGSPPAPGRSLPGPRATLRLHPKPSSRRPVPDRAMLRHEVGMNRFIESAFAPNPAGTPGATIRIPGCVAATTIPRPSGCRPEAAA